MKKNIFIVVIIFLSFAIWLFLWWTKKVNIKTSLSSSGNIVSVEDIKTPLSDTWSINNKEIKDPIDNSLSIESSTIKENDKYWKVLKESYNKEGILNIINTYPKNAWKIDEKLRTINNLSKYIINKDFFDLLYWNWNIDKISILSNSDKFWRNLIVDKTTYDNYNSINFTWKEKIDNIPVYAITFQILKWKKLWLKNEDILNNLWKDYPKFIKYFSIEDNWDIWIIVPGKWKVLNYSWSLEQYMDFIVTRVLEALWEKAESINAKFGSWIMISDD
jgi:hypothetical protein